MRPFLFALLFLLPPAVIAQAEERSLLERLQAETRKLAGSAAGAVVEVLARGSKQPSIGVLVGSPARLIVPACAAPASAGLTVLLHDFSSVQATLIAASADLGIAVYSLPGELKGIEPVVDWKDLRPGTLGLEVPPEARTIYRLRILSGANPVLGRMRTDNDASPGLLIGTHGRLIALRGTPPPSATNPRGINALFPAASRPVSKSTASAIKKSLTDLAALQLRVRQLSARLHTSDGIGGLPTGRLPYMNLPKLRSAGPLHRRLVTLPGPVIARVLQDLDRSGRIRQAYLGAVLGDRVDAEGRSQAAIDTVLKGSPAERAGLHAGERVLAISGVAIHRSSELVKALALLRPSETVTLRVVPASGKEPWWEVKVTLGDLAEAQRNLVSAASLGLECVELNPALRSFFGLGANVKGVLVRKVAPGSSAVRAGLLRGDVITWGAGSPITDLEELQAAIAAAGKTLSLHVFRGGEWSSFALAMPRHPTPR